MSDVPGPGAGRASRRGLLVAGLTLAGSYAGLRYGVPVLSERLAALDFAPLDRPDGFRRLTTTGSVSAAGTFDPFIGLDAPATGQIAPSCAGLFDAGTGDDGASGAGRVPVAYFSDYNCAFCRVLSPRLAALEGVRITWHELPLLGEGSTIMARAALAAGAQDAHVPFHESLMRTPRPSPESIARIAEGLGLDMERLRADMDGATVAAALDRSRAAAATFGFYATPSMVVGRTAVIGAVGEITLDRLLDRERADAPVPACA